MRQFFEVDSCCYGYQYLFDYMGLNGSTSLVIDTDHLTGPKTLQKAKEDIAALHPLPAAAIAWR